MPVYEYYCEKCQIEFEELLIKRDEIQKYQNFCPCVQCGEDSFRIPSVTNFQFKGTAEGDPTKVGNSGVHDLDYPTLDKAVGRSANRKWKEYGARKAVRDQARKKLGTNNISVVDNQIVSTHESVLDAREKGIKLFKKSLKESAK